MYNGMMGEERGRERPVMVDEMREKVGVLLRVRLPWLGLGLVGGLVASIVVSRFEKTIADNIALVFFLPVVVYMSDAVGTQTEAMLIRKLARGKVNFWKYLVKEVMLGTMLGVMLGIITGGIAGVWIGDVMVGWVVGVAMFINVLLAPVMALVIPEIMFKEHVDPAVGSGPFTTIVQDLVSVVVYLGVAAIIGG